MKIRTLLLCMLIAMMSSARAAEILVWTHQGGRGSITLLPGECKSAKILKRASDEGIEEQYQTAKIKWDGQDVEGCWALLQRSGRVCVLGEDNGHTDFDPHSFKAAEGS